MLSFGVSLKKSVCLVVTVAALVATAPVLASDLVITGVVDGPLAGGTPKGVELYAINSIADLSVYGVGSANNGGGTDGEEFTFPAMAVPAGSFIYVASEATEFTNFFGFAPDFTSSAANINGDDAIELFMNGSVVDVLGDINVDGTGEPWDHLDGWAYRNDMTGPDGATFVLSNWSFSGVDALDGETTNATATTPFPIGTYSGGSAPPAIVISGLVDGPLTGGVPKAIEFYAYGDVADLSLYGFGSANNGGGTDGEEFTFPAVSVTAGTYFYVASEAPQFTTFFGFAPNYTSSAAEINGDDAVELFYSGTVIDVFGDINVDGTGQSWDHVDGWAYRVDGTGPDGSTFVLANWIFSGPDALDGETSNGSAATPFPIGTYSFVPAAPPALLISGLVDGPLPGGLPKAIEFYAFDDIVDLSAYGFGSANNGGGTDGEEFTFPAVSVAAGTFFYVAMEVPQFTAFFGFAPDYTSSAAGINGDDAVELFYNGAVIDVFGDISVDGTGELWDHVDGWAYRVDGSGPDGATFVLANWTFSGPDALDGETDNATAAIPFPIGSYVLNPVAPAALVISGVVDGPLTGGLPKAVEFLAFADIPDLSVYGFGSANNGGGSDGQEFTFPAVSVSAGTFLYVGSESPLFTAFFGFAPDYTSGAANINGDDAIELFKDGVILDVFGEISIDGTGQPWEYLDGWAYRVNGTGPDGSTFVLANWFFSGPNALDGETTNATAVTPFPIGSYFGSGENAPRVDSTGPSDGSGNVPLDANITITFSEDVNVSGSWFEILCSLSGAHTAAVSGGPLSYVLDPDLDFVDSESCTVTVVAAGVTDVDLDDPPDTMTDDFVFSFLTPLLAEIFEIQGAGPASPFDGIVLTTKENVVTALAPNGFFMQTPAARSDFDADTSDGIFVFTGVAPTVSVGDLVDVVGRVVEFFDFTEITDATYTVTGSSMLPGYVSFNGSVPSPDPSISSCAIEFECYEGMLVEIASGAVTSSNQRFNPDPVAEVFITASPARTFREPGIEYPGLVGLPVWDGNPEVFELDPDKLGLPNQFIPAGSTFSAVGVIGFEFGGYEFWPSELMVSPAPLPMAVRAREVGEFTIGSLNLFRLFDDVDDPVDPDGRNDFVVSTAEYQRRLLKFTAYVLDVLDAPDVLAVQEAEKLGVLEALAAAISLADPLVVYTAELIEGNDIGTIDVGYLVRDTVSVTAVTQFGKDETFVNPVTLADDVLHDRPPLLFEGRYTAGGLPGSPVRVLNLHMRSLNSIDDQSSGVRVRQKRLKQAESVATIVQDLQTTDFATPLVVVGDMNAFEFTDGYVDLVGHIKGDFVPADNLVCDTNACADIVEPNLTDQVFTLAPEDRYSFIFRGNAQTLDHALTTSATDELVTGFEFGRANADAAVDLINDDGTVANLDGSFNDPALRSSDHDGFVVYLVGDSDQDGVVDGADFCADTAIPEDVPTRRLLPFRYALEDGDTTFDTRVPRWFPHEFPTYTTADTAGCSCEQILDEMPLHRVVKKISERFGCPLWLMKKWTDIVDVE